MKIERHFLFFRNSLGPKASPARSLKSMFTRIIILGLLLISFAFVSCTSPPRQYFPVTESTDPSVLTNNPKAGSNYFFSVIEFDDQGEMWQREQLYRTMRAIEKAKSEGYPITLVMFAHGWKNDASPESGNLNDFHQFVTNMARVMQTSSTNQIVGSDRKPRQLFGVYLGWRGNVYRTYPQWSVLLPLDLSFWNRKRVAGQVAGVSCTEAILSLAAQTRLGESDNAATNDSNNAQSQIILAGHSFGGLVVERAVTQAMLGSMLANVRAHGHDRKAGRWRPRPPFDMVLLINPASEALVAKKMIEAMENPLISQYAGTTNADARPWIISVSSKGDWATRLVFPIGREVGSLSDRLRVYEPRQSGQPDDIGLHSPTNYQRTFYKETAPQNSAMINHVITLTQTKTNSTYTNLDTEHLFRWLLRMNLQTDTNHMGSNLFNLSNQFIYSPGGGKNLIYTVEPATNSYFDKTNHPGYWIIQAPTDILPDHSTIFTPAFYAMAAGLYRMTQYHHTNHFTNFPPTVAAPDSN